MSDTASRQPSVGWEHLAWFARQFCTGFMLDAPRPDIGLKSRKELYWNCGGPKEHIWTKQIETVVTRLAMTTLDPFSAEGRPSDWSEGFAVSAHKAEGRPDATGQFLFDVCWHSYRASGVRICDYESCANSPGRVGIELAFESEFGDEDSPVQNMRAVLYDFAKLRECRARLKAKLFLFHERECAKLVECMKALADDHPVRLDPADSYLLIGASWEQHVWAPEEREHLWSIHGRAGNDEWRVFNAHAGGFAPTT